MDDSFAVPARGRAPTIRVQHWRNTLANGFENARGEGSSVEATLTIRIERADLALVAAGLLKEQVRTSAGLLAWAGDDQELPVLLAHGSHNTPKTTVPPKPAVYAEITYVAEFFDRGGRVFGRSQASVLSKMASSRTSRFRKSFRVPRRA